MLAAVLGSLLAAALTLGVCLLGAAVLLTRREPVPPPPVVIEKVVVTTPCLAAYDLLELIGSGTMGELWKAKHKALGRIVPAHAHQVRGRRRGGHRAF